MTASIEDRVTAALHETVITADAEAFLGRVRSGVRRRRRARAALVAGAVVALVAGVTVGLSRGGDVSPRPVDPVDVERGRPMFVTVSQTGTVWQVVTGQDCGDCAVLERRGPDASSWSAVGPLPGSGALTMVDDERGYYSGVGLWETDDGGATWTQVALPVNGDGTVDVAVGEDVWVLVRPMDAAPFLLNAPIGGSDWTEVTLPSDVSEVYELAVLPDSVAVLGFRGREDAGHLVALVSHDAGRSWTEPDGGCRPAWLGAGPSTLFAVCPRSDRDYTFLRSDGSTWTEWSRVDDLPRLRPGEVLSDDAVMVWHTQQERAVVVTVNGATLAYPPPNLFLASEGPYGTLYALSAAGTVASHDGGLTWGELP